MPTLDERWEAKFASLQEFLAARNRLPRQFCEDPSEKSLGLWLRGQRRAVAAGRLTVGRINRLRNLPVPGALEDPRGGPLLIDRLASFVETNGRLPKSTAADGSEEKVLARYLIHRLRPCLKDGTLPAGHASRAARIPGATLFRYVPDQDDKLDELRTFIADHGYLPRQTPNAAGPERALAQWVNNTRLKPDAGARAPETAARLQAFKELTAGVPTYRTFQTLGILTDIEAYVAGHGTLPPPRSDGRADPRYAWLQNRRLHGDAQDYGDLEPRITALLTLPGRIDSSWDARFAELVAYVETRGKLPTGFHDGQIYNWLRTQRARYRQGLLTAEREASLRTIAGILPKRGPGRPRRPAGKR